MASTRKEAIASFSIDKTKNNIKGEDNAWKIKFDKVMAEYFSSYHENTSRQPWTRERIKEVIKQIKQFKTRKDGSVSNNYYWPSKYDIVESIDNTHLIFKKKSPVTPTIIIMPVEEYYNVLKEVHNASRHGGRDKMLQRIKSSIYIPKKAIEIYINLCPACEKKRSLTKKQMLKVLKKFNERGYVNLIDVQSTPDGDYKWLLAYQDHVTKFIHLRPLKSNEVTEIALELLKIFLEFGAPHSLNSDFGRAFTFKVIKNIEKLWPECKIKFNNSQTNEVRTSSIEIKNSLKQWMHDNDYSTKWTVGCYFVQYKLNLTYTESLGSSSYKTLFGANPKNTSREEKTVKSTTMTNEDSLKPVSHDSTNNEIGDNEDVDMAEICVTIKKEESSEENFESINVYDPLIDIKTEPLMHKSCEKVIKTESFFKVESTLMYESGQLKNETNE